MTQHLSFLAQYNPPASDGSGVVGLLMFVVWLALVVLVIAGGWKTFEKAGQPGWGILIPIYNLYLMIKIATRPGWWLLLMFIPLVNVIFMIIVSIDIARNFGRGVGFGLGLAFLGPIFFCILGFGDAVYRPPVEPRGFPVTPTT